MLGDTTGIPNQ